VAFGASGRFNYATASGSIDCNVGVFGDPIYNTAKTCYVEVAAPAANMWAQCATENGSCPFWGLMTVAFGANGSYKYATLGGGGTNCTVGVFGDPASGAAKACFLVGAPPGFTTWTACAAENGACSFAGLHEVAFGANGQYFYRHLTGGTPCDVAVFGDPEPNVAKGCYVQ
jgi:hypothetical protein